MVIENPVNLLYSDCDVEWYSKACISISMLYLISTILGFIAEKC